LNFSIMPSRASVSAFRASAAEMAGESPHK
jgi:hypothetical protein